LWAWRRSAPALLRVTRRRIVGLGTAALRDTAASPEQLQVFANDFELGTFLAGLLIVPSVEV